MVTYQDFERLRKQGDHVAISQLISDWKNGDIYKTAILADKYDHQQNDTILNYIKKMFTVTGLEVEDFTASNNKITSNFFRRLNKQRNTYSLGNGVYFAKNGIKERFGAEFDTVLFKSAYKALIHGISFPFWNEKLYFFEATEFAPLWDEETGVLMGGVRFWQVDCDKPMYAVLYEKDGYTKYKKDQKDFAIIVPKKSYVVTVEFTEIGDAEIVDNHNYSALPIVSFWGSSLRQSTLVGLQSQIDSYDLIRSGFANDLTDVSQIYWLVENYGGMSQEELAKFRDRMKLQHIVEADTSEGGKITPYTQEVPFQARKAYLESIRNSMYEDFGALDVHAISATSTNDHIDAAYQPMDEEADDFEYQIIECVQALGSVLGIPADDCTPLFKRNRLSNVKEQVEILAIEAAWLDDETIVEKMPNFTPEEISKIKERLKIEEVTRIKTTFDKGDDEE